jgi:hypothetical protein
MFSWDFSFFPELCREPLHARPGALRKNLRFFQKGLKFRLGVKRKRLRPQSRVLSARGLFSSGRPNQEVKTVPLTPEYFFSSADCFAPHPVIDSVAVCFASIPRYVLQSAYVPAPPGDIAFNICYSFHCAHKYIFGKS